MKTAFLGFSLVLTALNAFADGTVFFYNRHSGTIVTRVYSANPSEWYRYGNTAADTPAGTQVYFTSLLEGAGWTAQLWSAPGADQTESALVAAWPTTTFRTGTAAGQVEAVTATLIGVSADAPVATLQMRVWESKYADWNQAEFAWRMGDAVGIGKSPLFNLYDIGGEWNTPPSLIGLQSFQLYGMIPEPTSVWLFGWGAATVFSLRRRGR